MFRSSVRSRVQVYGVKWNLRGVQPAPLPIQILKNGTLRSSLEYGKRRTGKTATVKVGGVSCRKTEIGTVRGNGCPAYSALPHPLKKDMDEKVFFYVNCIFLIFLRKQCVKKSIKTPCL